MRILFDSKIEEYKTPFGCVTPGQSCRLRIRIPASVGTSRVEICIERENGEPFQTAQMTFEKAEGAYHLWQGSFALSDAGLFFYYFRITGHTGTFRLFKYGDDTNMEAGDKWQLSCVPESYTVPQWAKGAVIYQVFPDRFAKAGSCDLTGKLEPYAVHENWNEEVVWQPNEKGEVLNNDFFGGNFRGITEKIDYIASLGTTILYLNPIGKSFSSHRYDTGDYKTPDPMLGTEADFKALCDAAHARGIRVVLDGVYSHTGADSLYFDKYHHFGGKGAYCSPDSPYYSWFQFKEYPDKYVCWWDFDTLPTVNKADPNFIEYIITGKDSVLEHWLALGADGFRLDVVDELPDEFVSLLKKHLRKLRPDALLMGEVWEDASNKVAYGVRRRYFTDGQLDSVMNYPFRTAIMKLLRGEDDGHSFRQAVMTILENYPKQVVCCNMNMLGTHDTPRALTELVDPRDGSREELAHRKLSYEQYSLAKKRLMLASVLQYTLPGCPSLYYGDEAGMAGGKDPFNRRTYPWGKEDRQLLEHFRFLGQLRKNSDALRLGDLEFSYAEGGRLSYRRTLENKTVKVYANCTDAPWEIPEEKLTLPGLGYCITEES